MTRIAVLGCGPAGLLAAHAVIQSGIEPVVYSIGNRSELPGTMYLHEPIPDLTAEEPDGTVTYRKVGTKECYAEKVYKDRLKPCSWDSFEEGEHPAWSARAMYDELWSRYHGLIRDQSLSPWDIDAMTGDFALIISAIPATALCRKPYHKFTHAEIWVSREKQPEVEEGEIIYNGARFDPWYRSCDIFGYQATEYGEFQDGLPRGIKPIDTNCDCHSDKNLIRVGRFGRWSKGELVHHAYGRTQRVVNAYAL